MTTIGLASDHAGFDLKCFISEHLNSKGFRIMDFGCFSDVSCDYPDFAHLIGNAMDNSDFLIGFVFCGSGNGINMTVNKHKSVRSALCWSTEIAYLARHHNNANICSLPSRFISNDDAIKIVDVFLSEEFDGGRHLSRVLKIPL